MGKIRLIVLDVLKPHTPSLIDLSSALSDIEGIEGVDSTVTEIDKSVETVKITLVGEDIDYEKIKGVIEKMAGSIHSVDKVSAGSILVKEASTPQDR
ncbi:DUF211 domain-containing protein [Candidatus Woesearchaeota archaeon]|nr:DUF211 domain-containing protein [Candidatus Woesearchaeota archaeon]